MHIIPTKWRRLSGEQLDQDLKATVESTILREKAAGHKLKLCIGSDSQVNGKMVSFATVIVFLREKKGGFMFIELG